MGRPKIMLAVPNMGHIHHLTTTCLFSLPGATDADLHYESIAGSLIYDARNEFCSKAVKENYDYIMFIDSDMTFPANTITKLLALNADIATAVCYGRMGKHTPQVYTEMKPTTWFRKSTISKRPEDIDGIFSIKACGMACCLVNVGLVREMFRRNINPFEPFGHLGEDFSFCVRAHKMGAVMLADGSIPIGHVGEAVYGAKDWVK